MLAKRLPDLGIFAHFAPAEFERLAAIAQHRPYGPGTRIIRMGEESRNIFVLLSGGARVSRQTSYGEIVLARLRAGEMVGEIRLTDSEVRSADVIGEEVGELVLLAAESLDAAAAEDQRFAVAFQWSLWKSLSAKIRTGNQFLTEFFPDGERPPVSEVPDLATYDRVEVGVQAKRNLFLQKPLSTMESSFLASLSRQERFTAGQTIFREGDPGDNLYVIVEGEVRIGKFIPGAGEEALAVLEHGAFFGEMALVDDEPRTATATAHTDPTVVLAISKDVLGGLLDIRRISSLRLLQMLCRIAAQRLRELDSKILGWTIMAAGESPEPPVSSGVT